MNLFSKRLKQLRAQNGTKQNTLAKYLHRCSGTVSNYENSVYEPDLETLIQIADFYKVSVDYLLGRTDYRALPDHLPTVIYGKYTVSRFLNLLGQLTENDRKALVYWLRVLEEARSPK